MRETIGKFAYYQNVVDNRGMAYIGNVQWGCLFKYADGQIDFYVYEDAASYITHIQQFREWHTSGEGKILWISGREDYVKP